MGKKPKQKPEDSATTATATPNKNGSSEVPLLSADALRKLTQTIQTNFEKAKVQPKDNSVDQTKEKKDKGKKRKKDVKELAIGEPEKSKRSSEKRNSSGEGSAEKLEPIDNIRGKKRARDGESKSQDTAEPKSKSAPHVNGISKVISSPKLGKKGKVDKEALLREIIELGGTQEDLDLVDDIDSDSEIEETEFNEQPSSTTGRGFKNELVGFMKEIGLEGGKFDALSDDEDEEWEEEEEDDDDDDLEDKDDSIDKPGGEKAAAPVTTFATPPDPKSKGSKLLFSPALTGMPILFLSSPLLALLHPHK